MSNFSFSTTRSILCEIGGARWLAQLCADLADVAHAGSVLLVTDAGIRRAGLLERVLPGFDSANLQLTIFDETEADPSAETVLNAVRLARDCNAGLVIGFGGGSSMDVAKLVALLAAPGCNQSLEQVYGVNNARGPRLPLIQVPTTAGTGSEVTPIAIVTTGANTKAGVVSPVLQPDLALLDAELTVGLPPAVTAATGIDAMVHAIEAYTSKLKKNPLSDLLAREALRLLAGNIVTAVLEGDNLRARGNMLLGALLAGQAFANAPVAAVHALAYPLGAHFHIPHGLSNSLVLPHVLRFNAPATAHLYAELAPIATGDDFVPGSAVEVTESLILWLEGLIARLGLPARLRDCGVTEDSLTRLAADAMQQQRLLVNNPREVCEDDALQIYRTAY